MRTHRLYPERGTGVDDGGISQAPGDLDGTRGTGRDGTGTVEKTDWFDAVETECKDGFCPMPQRKVDMVNHPPHYANPKKKIETIDKIEDAVQFAPDAVLGGLQWQVLKYMDRLWDKGNPKQDASKALWYLQRLIDKLD
jgi:hypothetical protein